jgi:hypothetical protein
MNSATRQRLVGNVPLISLDAKPTPAAVPVGKTPEVVAVDPGTPTA